MHITYPNKYILSRIPLFRHDELSTSLRSASRRCTLKSFFAVVANRFICKTRSESTYLSHWDPPTPGKHEHSPVIALHDWLTEPPALHEQPEKVNKQASFSCDTNIIMYRLQLIFIHRDVKFKIASKLMNQSWKAFSKIYST